MPANSTRRDTSPPEPQLPYRNSALSIEQRVADLLSRVRISRSARDAGPDQTRRTAHVAVTLANTGARAGDEVVQLYGRDQISSVTRPVQELKGGRRVILAPGESRAIEFEITPEQQSALAAQLERRAEPGLFALMVGGSSTQLPTVLLEVTA